MDDNKIHPALQAFVGLTLIAGGVATYLLGLPNAGVLLGFCGIIALFRFL